MRDRRRQERAALRQRYPQFPEYEEWRRDRCAAGSSASGCDRPSKSTSLSVDDLVALASGAVGMPRASLAAGDRPAAPADGWATEIYRRHGQDIRSREGNALDRSRVDAMIAVRLRVTGHSRDEIVATLANGPPTFRAPGEERDWPRYAARVVRYAFGPAGDREVERLARYREPWRALENQPAQRLPRTLSPSWR